MADHLMGLEAARVGKPFVVAPLQCIGQGDWREEPKRLHTASAFFTTELRTIVVEPCNRLLVAGLPMAAKNTREVRPGFPVLKNSGVKITGHAAQSFPSTKQIHQAIGFLTRWTNVAETQRGVLKRAATSEAATRSGGR